MENVIKIKCLFINQIVTKTKAKKCSNFNLPLLNMKKYVLGPVIILLIKTKPKIKIQIKSNNCNFMNPKSYEKFNIANNATTKNARV